MIKVFATVLLLLTFGAAPAFAQDDCADEDDCNSATAGDEAPAKIEDAGDSAETDELSDDAAAQTADPDDAEPAMDAEAADGSDGEGDASPDPSDAPDEALEGDADALDPAAEVADPGDSTQGNVDALDDLAGSDPEPNEPGTPPEAPPAPLPATPPAPTTPAPPATPAPAATPPAGSREIGVDDSLLKTGHPDEYTVKKGDALWDISGTFLNSPWLWPEIWHVNPKIENPHLIFPGDLIKLVYLDGRPRLTLERTLKMVPGAGGGTNGTTKLSPSIRVQHTEDAIRAIPLDKIEVFLSRSRITDDIATLDLIRAFEEVRPGDHLLPSDDRSVDSIFFPSAPDDEIHGQIVAVEGGVSQVGKFNVVMINRGERGGLQIGNVLAIYQIGKVVTDRVNGQVVTLSDERSGLLMVFRTFEQMSFALVLEADRAVAVKDKVANP